MNLDALHAIAVKMVAPGKGILAADESSGTIKKRFDAIKVENTEENRRDYREMLLRTTAAMKDHISGVILFDETIRQKAKDGTPLVRLIEQAGAIPGIKVDKGAKPMALFSGETITEGLDGLRERFVEYHGLGARFAKWRAVFRIADDGLPTQACVHANADALARYAALCQEAGLVPIVEPEVLMDGAHTLARCAEVTERTLQVVFDALRTQRVLLEGVILKPNMVVPGLRCPTQDDADAVADATVRVFRRVVPAAVGGVAFLSGGQPPSDATARLDAMHVRHAAALPWPLAFSFARAIQDPAMKAWAGKADNVAAVKLYRSFGFTDHSIDIQYELKRR